MQQQGLFSSYKYCEYCRKPLPLNYEETYCPHCKSQQLFREVKEYIRDNNVNEYDVAMRFNIPLQQVKDWIQEGRIEYKHNSGGDAIISTHCKECGTPISFGTVCTRCLKRHTISGHTKITRDDLARMRYFEDFNK